MPLGGGRVTAGPGRLPAGLDRQPGLDPADPGLQAAPLGPQVPPGQLVAVLAGAGDGPGPPGGGFRGQRPLARCPGMRPAPRVQPPLSAPGGQVPARQRPEMSARRPQHGLVLRRGAQPGPRPHAPPRGRHERRRDRAEGTSHQPAVAGTARKSAFTYSEAITIQRYMIVHDFAIYDTPDKPTVLTLTTWPPCPPGKITRASRPAARPRRPDRPLAGFDHLPAWSVIMCPRPLCGASHGSSACSGVSSLAEPRFDGFRQLRRDT